MAIYWMGAFVFCNGNGFLKAVFKSDVCAYLRIIFSSTSVQNMEQVHYLENNCSELMLKLFYECLVIVMTIVIASKIVCFCFYSIST